MVNIIFFIPLIAIILFSITIHEYAHGKAAEIFGDPTPRLSGRLSLNPLSHIDPVGFLMLIFFKIGWAKPVPINQYYFKDPEKDMAFVALAGPFANFTFAIIVSVIYKLFIPYFGIGNISDFISNLARYTIWINIGLGIFNLIPIPPLDGSRLIRAILPYEGQVFLDRLEPYGFFVLIILLFSGLSNVLFYLIEYFAAFLF